MLKTQQEAGEDISPFTEERDFSVGDVSAEKSHGDSFGISKRLPPHPEDMASLKKNYPAQDYYSSCAKWCPSCPEFIRKDIMLCRIWQLPAKKNGLRWEEMKKLILGKMGLLFLKKLGTLRIQGEVLVKSLRMANLKRLQRRGNLLRTFYFSIQRAPFGRKPQHFKSNHYSSEFLKVSF